MLFSKLAASYGINLEWGITTFDHRIMDTLESDLARGSAGRAFFMHLLIPHSPFARAADCSVNYSGPLWMRFATYSGEVANNETTRGPRYLAYLAQAACSLSVLDRLFAKMRALGIYDEATIIVHGDHGSRVFFYEPLGKNLNKVGPGDLKDAFSVLFARKMPHGEFSRDHRTLALENLMRDTVTRIAGETSGPIEPTPPFIYFSDTFPLRRVDIDIFDP